MQKSLQKLGKLKTITKSLCLVLFSIGLAGCASQKFDCPYNEGVRCQSLSEVDNAVTHSNAVNNAFEHGTSKTLRRAKKLIPLPAPDSPIRTTEEVLTLWVAPYQTEDGTYCEEKKMHFVAKAAEWKNTVVEPEVTQ